MLNSEELKITHTRDVKDACNQTYNRKEQIFPNIEKIEISGNISENNRITDINDEIRSRFLLVLKGVK